MIDPNGGVASVASGTQVRRGKARFSVRPGVGAVARNTQPQASRYGKSVCWNADGRRGLLSA